MTIQWKRPAHTAAAAVSRFRTTVHAYPEFSTDAACGVKLKPGPEAKETDFKCGACQLTIRSWE